MNDKQGGTPADAGAWTRESAERLSALLDGEADATATAALSRAWSAHGEARADWHAWNVIGDALRSDELVGRGREAAFLAGVRRRLADEPIVLAPTPPTGLAVPAAPSGPRMPSSAAAGRAAAVRVRRPRWMQGAAVAAGFAAVAAVLVTLNTTDPAGPGVQLAAESDAMRPGMRAVVAGVPAPESSPVQAVTVGSADGRAMLRDARIDAYLEAHRQLGPAAWMAVPAAAVQPEPGFAAGR